jgi:hypothetical protein
MCLHILETAEALLVAKAMGVLPERLLILNEGLHTHFRAATDFGQELQETIEQKLSLISARHPVSLTVLL